MALQNQTSSFLEHSQGGYLFFSMALDSLGWYLGLSFVFLSSYASLRIFRRYSKVTKLPRLNEKGPWEITRTPAATRYAKDSFNMMKQAVERFIDTPFRVSSLDRGETVVLPQRFVHQVSTDPRLSFTAMVSKVSYGYLNTFDIFQTLDSPTEIVQRVVRQGLTRALPKLTDSLRIQADLGWQKLLPQDTKNWTEAKISPIGLRLIARLSTLALLGQERCEDESWADQTISFILTTRNAAAVLRTYPGFLRRIVNALHPACWLARAERNKAAAVVMEEVEKRRRDSGVASADKAGFDTLLAWYEANQQASGFDDVAVTVQLMLSFAAVLTSTDLLCQVILDLAAHRELIQPLRDEITSVIKTEGWSKPAMYKLALLDSVIKESQRLKPVQVGLMERKVKEDFTLIDPSTQQPIHLKEGECVQISPKRMRDPTVYPDPDAFDGYRFFRMRFGPMQQEKAPGDILDREYKWQLVSMSPDHLGFGIGPHSCPGRFFVANELKIALCNIIMKYDWKLAAEKPPQPWTVGNVRFFDISAKILVKRREESFPWL